MLPIVKQQETIKDKFSFFVINVFVLGVLFLDGKFRYKANY